MSTPTQDQVVSEHLACAGPAARDQASCEGALDNDLGWALGAVFRSYARAADWALADLPSGPRGFQVLSVARENPRTQLALAAVLGVDRTVMTYLLDDLEKAGLVERRPDPADRRARRVVLTEAGVTRLAESEERLRNAEEHVLQALPEEERPMFRRLLTRLATAALEPGDTPCGVAAEIGERTGARNG